MQRRPSQELLDSDAGSPQEVAASLRDLRWFNRHFGGVATSYEMARTAARRVNASQLSLLEVAAGEGFVQSEVTTRLSQENINLRVMLLDRAPSHLPANRSMPKLAADALRLPFPDAAFDLVSNSLFAHHLSPGDVTAFLREALRVCRIAVLIHDLVRHPLHLAWAYAGVPLYRSRITRNDAPASVRQAYTPDEMREFCRKAGASEIEIQRHFLFRMGVIAWKQA
jgi:ubiquinone/menaquinone biosynthesis C-methylase UbiE